MYVLPYLSFLYNDTDLSEFGLDLGYNALPFLIRSELLLFPIVIFFGLWIVSLLGFNIAKKVLGVYFGI